jgi:hypothetical protein
MAGQREITQIGARGGDVVDAPISADQDGGVDLATLPDDGTAGHVEPRARAHDEVALRAQRDVAAGGVALADAGFDTGHGARDIRQRRAGARVDVHRLVAQHAVALQRRVLQLVAAQFHADHVARHVDRHLLLAGHVDARAGVDLHAHVLAQWIDRRAGLE